MRQQHLPSTAVEFTPWPNDIAHQYRDKGYWLDLPLTEILSEHRNSDSIAIVCGKRTYTYRDLDSASSLLALHFCEHGLGPGDTALVQLPNVAELYITFFALLKAGIAPVNALFNHQRLELTEYARQLEPSLLIASRDHALFADDGYLEELKALTNIRLTLFHRENLTRVFDKNIESKTTNSFLPTNPEQVAFFQLSGGSTGTPKLIPRTHNDYFYSVRRSVEICGFSPATRFLVALPAAHNFPLSSPGALGVLFAGGTLVMASNPEPTRCFELIEQHSVNTTALVPSAVLLWLAHAATAREKLRTLTLLQVGGANFSETTARRVSPELGCKLQQVFGMAEGLVNYTRLDDSDKVILTSQGRPMSPADEIRIINSEGEDVAPGHTGQLITRGPYTIRGYYKTPQHNNRAFDNQGFYYSGDLVQQTPDGNIRVVGRVKDQINRGGEKIAAEEIENLLVKHPQIINAALVALPDERLGEKSCACLVTQDEKIKPLVVRKFLRAQGVAEFKLPDHIAVLPEFPLTAVGKINKKALRAHMQSL
ncbi:(2,3-dihydroxybenzoyl)adenylate synthase [Teredinibacter turnerae]|uniref:(2,3-dihydroxybenzoyl)adenylate synthase n=1 Tax=Teredinibacter turnerae TaxID=2426 RepID=UPI0003737AAD|nr:(2,3-dihydroxybenzoyl)adenylate synthase [Teredinibacter turnerae]